MLLLFRPMWWYIFSSLPISEYPKILEFRSAKGTNSRDFQNDVQGQAHVLERQFDEFVHWFSFFELHHLSNSIHESWFQVYSEVLPLYHRPQILLHNLTPRRLLQSSSAKRFCRWLLTTSTHWRLLNSIKLALPKVFSKVAKDASMFVAFW